MSKNTQTNLNLFEAKELETYDTMTLNTENLLNAINDEEEIIDELTTETESFIDENSFNTSDMENVEFEEADDLQTIVDDINQIDESIELGEKTNFSPVISEEEMLKNASEFDTQNFLPDEELEVTNIVTEDFISSQIEIEEEVEDQVGDSLDLKKDIFNMEEELAFNSEELVIENEDYKDEVLLNNYGKVKIKAIGIGGCGCNTIDRMKGEGFEGIDLVAMDTSAQKLELVEAEEKILLGKPIFKGHGSGGDAQRTAEVIQDSRKVIENVLKDVDMVFITGGIGKGTGSAGLVEIGKIAREMGILTIGFATLPKLIECDINIVEHYYKLFVDSVDSNVIVENDKVAQAAKDLPIREAMRLADKMLVDGIKGISDLIINPGKINLDYADIKTAFSNQGSCIMGIGYGKGESPVIEAINSSIDSELIDSASLKTANTIVFNITCAKNTITIKDAQEGTDLIYARNSDHDIKHMLFGYSYDESLNEQVKVTFIATGTEPISFEQYKGSKNSSFSSGSKTAPSVNNLFTTVSASNDTTPDFFK